MHDELIVATIRDIAADHGAHVAPLVAPSFAPETTPAAMVAARKLAQVEWAHESAEIHVTVHTPATLLFDLARAVDEIVLELEREMASLTEATVPMYSVSRLGRALRNALDVQGQMHRKSSDVQFDSMRLPAAYDATFAAFEDFVAALKKLVSSLK